MKFSCYKQDLIDSLKLVIKSVAIKSQTPILGSILLKADGNTLELQSTDNKTTTLARIPVCVESPGKTCVTGKLFSDVIAKMPDETVTIDADKNCVIKSGAAQFELLTFDAADFPTSNPVEGKSFQLSAKHFKQAIKKVAGAAATDDSRPIFTGVFFELADNHFRATATNTHRLNHFKIPVGDIPDSLNAVIPADVLKNIVIVLPDDQTPIKITFADKRVAFTFHNFMVSTRLLDGQFPPYERVLNTDTNFSVIVDRNELKNALNRVNVIAKASEFNTVTFLLDSDELIVKAKSSDAASASESIEIKDGQDGFSIAFNINYLIDLLAVIDKPKIKIAFGEPITPAIFQPVDDDDFIALVTPVRQ